MLKVECEACKAPYQVDERRVPPTGLKMRCPKCGHAFTVSHPDAAVSSAPASKHTILGISAPGLGASAPPPKGPVADELDLPQAVVAKPPPAKPAKPPPPKIAPLPAAPALGEIDELLDLPAMPAAPPPAVKPIPPVKPTLVSTQGQAKAPIPSLSDYDIDLPSPVADLPAKPTKPAAPTQVGRPAPPKAAPPPAPAIGGALTFDVDLPSPAGGGADLPSAKPVPGGKQKSIPFADLPSPKDNIGLPAPRDNIGLPAARDNVGLPAARDNIGLPAARDNVGLPAAFGEIGLPSPAGSGGFGSIDLPVIGGALPAVASALPALGGSLPASVDQGSYLPRATGASSHLPAVMGGDMHLPTGSGDRHLPSTLESLPAALSDSQFLPAAGGGGFGEADLGFGAPEAKAAPRPPPPPPPPAAPIAGGQVGGVGFGELDFGSGGGDVSVEADVGPASLRDAGGEAALPTEGGRSKTRERVVIDKSQGRAVKIAAAGAAVLFVLGAAMQLTRYGAFGFHVINDAANKGTWTTEANEAMAETRKAFGVDVYDKARAAADKLTATSNATPRAQAIMSAAALAEYEFQLRFGRDAARGTRADGWLKSIAEVNSSPASIPYYTAASAARAAAGSDIAAARTAAEAAAQKDPGDPVQQDVALVRGELELRAKDAAAATKAFSRALQIAPSARAHFGLARSYALTTDHAKARAEIAATLAATPNHPGALILKASLDWSDERNDAAVIEGLKPLLEGPAKATASQVELSHAYTVYGVAQASRGDVGAARTAFEGALKLDSTNSDALLGQGDVFFAEGRFTEALSRFDTAVQADPTNPSAIIDDAKAKLELDRLSDAKTQLTAAQKAMPKDSHITFWLGRAEEKLGNKKGAEDAYVAAIALTNPTDRDAIQPYVALSTLLASQGRATEAAARLAEARAKLPDSSAMQRALGEVAAAQGLFDEAIAHFQQAVSRDPHDIKAVFQLGETYLAMRKLDEASAQFDKVEQADHDYPNLAMRRGELLEQSGHVEQALEQFRAALARAPKDLDLQLRVGAAQVGIGRGEEGEKTLKPVYDERQSSAEVNHYLGRAYLLQGGTHLVDAKRFLGKAADLEPTKAQYHLYLAWVATDSQDWKLAETEVARTLQLDQLNGDAYWLRAVAEEVHGAVDDAIKDADKALQLRPARVEAHATLARCYADKNQNEKALAEWALATAHGTEHPEWEYLYGRLLFERNNLAQALPMVLAAAKAAEQMNPPPVWAARVEFMTGAALLKSGNKIDANEHFMRFMEVAERTNPDRPAAEAALKSMNPDWRPPSR